MKCLLSEILEKYFCILKLQIMKKKLFTNLIWKYLQVDLTLGSVGIEIFPFVFGLKIEHFCDYLTHRQLISNETAFTLLEQRMFYPDPNSTEKCALRVLSTYSLRIIFIWRFNKLGNRYLEWFCEAHRRILFTHNFSLLSFHRVLNCY